MLNFKKISQLALATLALNACSKSSSQTPLSESCPEDLEEIARTDFELDAPAGAQLKAGFIASEQIQFLAGSIELELVEQCSALAKDLFVTEKQLEPEDFSLGNEALHTCTLAAEALTKLKGLAGGTLELEVGLTRCSTAMNAADTCFAACGSGSPAVSCQGELSGTCPGKCDGQCTLEEEGECAGSCGGSCRGSCDSEFKGECRGTCEGLCDGKESKEACEGVCEGRCLEGARGECGGVCQGQCDGACTVEAAGECEGTCAGSCDQKLVETQCEGPFELTEGVDDCSQSCLAGLLANLKCQKPSVEVSIESPANEEAAQLLAAAVRSHLPGLLASRALNISPDRLSAAGDHAQGLLEAMAPLFKAQEEPNGKAVSCSEESEKNGASAISALPTLLSASDQARQAGETGSSL